MNVRVCGVIVALLAGGHSFAQGPNIEASVDEAVHEAMNKWEVPGAALVVIKLGANGLIKGYGQRDLTQKERVTQDTLFPLASCSKAFTTTALAMLVDEGKLGWDDPVRKYLPEFHLADPNADALVTVRDLVCHRTGVGSHDYLWKRAPWSQEEMIRRIGKVPLSGQFRSSFAYQSIMFMAAGKIVGLHHPGGWAEFVRERLFHKLGMTGACTTSVEAAKRGNVAIGYKLDRDGKVVAAQPYPMPEPNPAGSIYCNARDLAKWLEFQLGDGKWHGTQVVSSDCLAETHRPQSIIPSNEITRTTFPYTAQLTYAMGWVVSDYRGVKVLSHAGLIDGFRCQLTLLPAQGIAIGLLDNLHATWMNLALTNRLIDLLLELPVTDWNAYFGEIARHDKKDEEETRRRREELRKRGERPGLPLEAYVGKYENPAYGIAEVSLQSGKLVWHWGSFTRDLLAFHGDTFELRDVLRDEQDVGFVVDHSRVVRMNALDVVFDRKPN